MRDIPPGRSAISGIAITFDFRRNNTTQTLSNVDATYTIIFKIRKTHQRMEQCALPLENYDVICLHNLIHFIVRTTFSLLFMELIPIDTPNNN